MGSGMDVVCTLGTGEEASKMTGRKTAMHQFFDNYYMDGGWKHDEFGAAVYRKRVEYLSALIRSIGNDMLVLDLGCGKGEVGRHLSDGNTVFGLDISKTALMTATKYVDGVVVGDAQELPFHDRTFDSVVFAESIYYLDDPVGSLEEIRRVLKTDGCLVLACGTANAPSLWLMLLLLKILNRTIRIHTSDGAHWKTERYTMAQLRRFLELAGFNIENEIGYFFKIPLLTQKRFIPLMVRIGELLPMFSSYAFFFARKT